MPTGTEFSYVTFTEQRNFTTAERQKATEWWQPGISLVCRSKLLGTAEAGHFAGCMPFLSPNQQCQKH